MPEQQPSRTLEIIDEQHETVLLFAVHPPLSYDDIKKMDAVQDIHSAKPKIPSNRFFISENAFSKDPHFGMNAITHAVVTPHDSADRTILGFYRDTLTQSPVNVLMFLSTALERALQDEVKVIYPKSVSEGALLVI